MSSNPSTHLIVGQEQVMVFCDDNQGPFLMSDAERAIGQCLRQQREKEIDCCQAQKSLLGVRGLPVGTKGGS
jgi:hypothetical protein